MDVQKVEKLIESVRGHIYMYDLGHKQYKNASLKSAIWESIGKDLNESGETVRSKWKTIRDGYTKYKKQAKCSTGSGRKNVSYTWASQLAFLDNFNVPRASCSNVQLDATQPSPDDTPSIDPDTENPSPVPSTSSSSQVPPCQVLPQESPASRVPYCKRKRSTEDTKNDDDVSKVIEFLKSKKKKEYDVIDHLFLTYADTFKKFPPRTQAVVKLKLATLFTNTELQLLSNNSESDFQYNSTVSPAYSTTTSVHSPKPLPINLAADNSNVAVENSGELFEMQSQSIEEKLPLLDDYHITVERSAYQL